MTLAVVAALVAASCSSDDDSSAETTAPPDTTPSTDAATTTAPPDTTPETTEPAPTITEDRAFYILPPGNYGGLPVNDDSTDQLALYDGLTPLRGDITDADIEELFLPADFEPIGDTREEVTGRDGVTIIYDEFGIPHVTGDTRDDVAFGAGWVTARDRALLLDLGRGPSRVAVADVPGIDAFSLVTSAQEFIPSAATEQLVTDQVQLILDTYGAEGEEIIADARAYVDGVNAYRDANAIEGEPFTVNDVIAVTAFIGSIFGAGGGGEAANAEFLSGLQATIGDEQGRQVWEDFLPTDDPEAPTTIEERFDYPALTGGEVTGSLPIDAGSLVSLDPRPAVEPAGIASPGVYGAATGPPSRTASNWLLVDPAASENATTLAVMGPQLGYFYPEIVQQIHLSGPGIEAQGAAVPGLAMYLLIGRTADYAWSLTSANQDVRDVYAEILCEPDGSTPTIESDHYEYEGACIAFEQFDAGTLAGDPIVFPTSVHGPVIGSATSEGRPVALASKRSTFGRDGLNLAALKDMTEGDADTPENFFESANKFGFTFNWGYANREAIAYYASGLLPVRPAGLDRRLPTLGTGEYEWEGFLELDEKPHSIGGPDDRLVNWNNQSAPGFMHGDSTQFGSVHRVENFDQWPDQVDLAGVVGVMNRAATEEVAATVWPVISEVLAGGDAPTAEASEAVAFLDGWVADDAPRLDADDDGLADTPGPLLFDEIIDAVGVAVREPVLGPALDAGVDVRGIDAASHIDKDLRSLLGQPVEGAFNLGYCGAGDLDACRTSLWEAIDGAVAAIAAERGGELESWLPPGQRSTFAPGLIEDDFRSTNRPTFQQVIEFAPM